MTTDQTWCILLMIINVIGCSQPSAPTPGSSMGTPTEKQLTTAELSKLYDPSSLVEAKTLGDLPADLQSVLGVHANGYARIADVGEPCNPTDVIGNDPGRCFFVGGVSATSALIAFKIGGYAGQTGVGEAYVHTASTWIKVESWSIGFPSDLKALREMVSIPRGDPPSAHAFDSCFRIVNGTCSY
jgi:hypothetical protein